MNGRGTTTSHLLGAETCVGCGVQRAILCPACLRRLERPVRDTPVPGARQVLAPWDYAGAARSIVLALKLRGRRSAALPMADAMCREALACGLESSAITWIPGHSADKRVRGFDHAEVLAGAVGARLGLPVVRLLRRTGRGQADQSALSRKDRWANLEGAFVGVECPAKVLIVDDLVTTGATAGAGSAALRSAGAHTVEILVTCRV
jgi:predicted amidophosphoribosyltransferase